jgi:hypothetical protein
MGNEWRWRVSDLLRADMDSFFVEILCIANLHLWQGVTTPPFWRRGMSYYLHVFAYDEGGIAGLLGDFSLSGTSHTFANGLLTITTDTTHWTGNTTGFNGIYDAVSGLGVPFLRPSG